MQLLRMFHQHYASVFGVVEGEGERSNGIFQLDKVSLIQECTCYMFLHFPTSEATKHIRVSGRAPLGNRDSLPCSCSKKNGPVVL